MTTDHQRSGMRAFRGLLVNTLLANTTTGFLWFSLVFWVYLETRSIMATSLLGGAYMLSLAVMGVPFGTLIDRHKKWTTMAASSVVTTATFCLAGLLFVLLPSPELSNWRSPLFWVFALVILVGAVVESIRHLGLSTSVTILVPAEGRARANGLVGIVSGLAMAVNSVLSGLAVGYLGMGGVMAIGVVLTVATLVHFLAFIRIPEEGIVHGENLPHAVDFRGAWLAITAIPGLLALILFTTFNNLLGGVFMALLDPYGPTLMSVQAWGIVFGVVSFAFILGGLVIARRGLGANPIRSILLASVAIWIVAGVFTIRESVVLLVVGIFVYLAIVPVIEAGEQTVLQTVVPYEKQGRVFGFAQSLEVAAAPLTAFAIGPIAEFWLIPYMDGPGEQQLGWLLGEGDARGIALVFLLASIVGLAVTVLAFSTHAYPTLSKTYADAFPQSTT